MTNYPLIACPIFRVFPIKTACAQTIHPIYGANSYHFHKPLFSTMNRFKYPKQKIRSYRTKKTQIKNLKLSDTQITFAMYVYLQ